MVLAKDRPLKKKKRAKLTSCSTINPMYTEDPSNGGQKTDQRSFCWHIYRLGHGKSFALLLVSVTYRQIQSWILCKNQTSMVVYPYYHCQINIFLENDWRTDCNTVIILERGLLSTDKGLSLLKKSTIDWQMMRHEEKMEILKSGHISIFLGNYTPLL